MPADPKDRMKWQMFGLSFTALFLELMVIRWVPSVVPFIAYYANLMLLSSFLGLGVGAMAGKKKWVLFDFLFFLFYESLFFLGSFVGWGGGAMAEKKKGFFFDWFPVFLACEIGT